MMNIYFSSVVRIRVAVCVCVHTQISIWRGMNEYLTEYWFCSKCFSTSKLLDLITTTQWTSLDAVPHPGMNFRVPGGSSFC